MDEGLVQKLKKVKLVLLDSDGVLTDGRLMFDSGDGEWCAFDVKDGFGIRALLQSGIAVAIISGRNSKVTERRGRALGVDDVFIGVREKRIPFRRLLEKYSFEPEEVLFVADDVYDLPLMKEVGVGVAVADAVVEVREAADYVTNASGGRGAVREVAELLLRTQNLWEKVIARLFDEQREDSL